MTALLHPSNRSRTLRLMMRFVAISKALCVGWNVSKMCQPAKTVLCQAVSRILLFKQRRVIRRLFAVSVVLLFVYQLLLFSFVARQYLQTSRDVKEVEVASSVKQETFDTIFEKARVEGHILKGLGISRTNKFEKNGIKYSRDEFLPFKEPYKNNAARITRHGESVEHPTFPRPKVPPTATKFYVRPVSKSLCPVKPPGLRGELEFRFNSIPPTLQEISLDNPQLQVGGRFQPANCLSRHRVAFIIPHRDREVHLRALLWHLNPIWQRQQLHYKVYVVHQAGDLAFNKAKLMNIGFLEATKEDDYDCIVFHDVDMLPENDKLLYTCRNTPQHMSVAIDKYDYQLPYLTIFGGVTMLTPTQFRDVNGFSNKYWGWGGEDDDMFRRLFARGYTITRPPRDLARYKMSFHYRDKGNKPNRIRHIMLDESSRRMMNDGLNNLQYSIVDVSESTLYTNITADVGTAMLQCDPSLNNVLCKTVSGLCLYLGTFCSYLHFKSTDDGTL